MCVFFAYKPHISVWMCIKHTYYPVKPCIKEFCSLIYQISLTMVSPRAISRYHPRKNQRNNLLVTKEALIGEHNLKPLLTGHKKGIDWLSLLGNRPVITQVHSYDILVINTHPRIRVIIRISYSSWVNLAVVFNISMIIHLASI